MLAPTAQDRTLTTTRGSEVVSDPTNVLALLCARRLTKAAPEDVRLCTVHQVLRAQPLPPQAGFSRHFSAAEQLGCAAPARQATIYSSAAREVLARRVRERLVAAFPHVTFHEERFHSRYYDDLRIFLGARAASGDHVPLADLGLFTGSRASPRLSAQNDHCTVLARCAGSRGSSAALRDVQHDRARLEEDQRPVLDRGDLSERLDPAVVGALRGAACVPQGARGADGGVLELTAQRSSGRGR